MFVKLSNLHIQAFVRAIEPYRDVIRFILCLLAAHFFWKFTVIADEHGGGPIVWMGWDISAPFDILSAHITRVCYWVISHLRNTIRLIPPDVLRFDSGISIGIVWSCTALKQSFIWLVIMLFARGCWKRKLWFIPFGWLCIYVFNIFRITTVALLVEYHHNWFDFLHTYLFKYLFYGMLFLLWVWWVEKIGKKSTRLSPQVKGRNNPHDFSAGEEDNKE